MARMAWTLIFLLALTSGAGAQQGGTIEGVVSRADTGAPIVGAQVRLSIANATSNGFAAVSGTALPGVPPITTDKDGRFSFGKLEPGTYRVLVQALDSRREALGSKMRMTRERRFSSPPGRR